MDLASQRSASSRLRRVGLPALACLLLLGAPRSAPGGTIYTWTDSRGHLHATRSLLEVPREHRAEARRRAEEARPSRLQTYRLPAPSGSGSLPGSGLQPAAAAVALSGSAVHVPFERRGTLMVVDVMLNDRLRAPFLVDTGASGVSIPERVARELGIRIDADTPRLLVQTAAGPVSEPVIRLDSVQVGGARVEQLDALVNSSMEIGLLGGSFFNNFVYRVDAASQTLSLAPNDAVRAGLTRAQWHQRFGELQSQQARLEQHLEGELTDADRRRELEVSLERVRASLEDLQREANAAGVPRAWRR